MHVKTLCLGALCLREGTGYEIKKLFESVFSHFHSASYGSIYPALNQLQKDGMATCRVEPGEKHPDRKLFSVTSEGREAFVQALATTPPSEHIRSEFLVLMFFAHLLSTEHLREILDEVETHYQSELAYLESIPRDRPSPGALFTIDYGIACISAKLGFIRGRRDEILRQHRQAPSPDCEC